MVAPLDAGFKSPEDCPIPIDRAGVPGGNGFSQDDIVTTDDEDSFICPRAVPSPWEPSADIVARHNLTHLPYQNWCPHCVAARKNNMAHQNLAGKSASRALPLLVLDYCYLRENSTEDQLCVLVGRLYPSRALFATPCDHKGQHDKHTGGRLCQFLRSSGASSIVYKSDQENAAVSVIQEAVRVSKLPDHPFRGVLESAVPETSAAGQSQSNGRAERAVQQIEDLARTYLSALESRLDVKIQSSHPIVRWLVEHSANTYNKYAVTPDGQTPYAALHGKNPREKLIEFGERVLWHVPKKLRAKLDLRWRLGVYVGYSVTSNEYYLGLPNGNVVKSR